MKAAVDLHQQALATGDEARSKAQDAELAGARIATAEAFRSEVESLRALLSSKELEASQRQVRARRRLETMLAALSWRQGCSARRCSRRSVRRLPGGRSLYLPAPALSQRRSASS